MTACLPPPPRAALADTLGVVDAVLSALARRLPPHVSREDLASAGKVALIETLLRFDGPADQARAFCYARVRGAMLDELRRLDPLSRGLRAQLAALRRVVAALEARLGRVPATEEIAAACGCACGTIRRLERAALAAESCSLQHADEVAELLEVLADDEAPGPAQFAESGDVADGVRAALDRLPPNHAHVLRRYHLDDATLEEIAAELAVSKERVRQLREAAEKRLRADFVVLALWQSVLARAVK